MYGVHVRNKNIFISSNVDVDKNLRIPSALASWSNVDMVKSIMPERYTQPIWYVYLVGMVANTAVAKYHVALS